MWGAQFIAGVNAFGARHNATMIPVWLVVLRLWVFVAQFLLGNIIALAAWIADDLVVLHMSPFLVVFSSYPIICVGWIATDRRMPGIPILIVFIIAAITGIGCTLYCTIHMNTTGPVEDFVLPLIVWWLWVLMTFFQTVTCAVFILHFFVPYFELHSVVKKIDQFRRNCTGR